MAYTNPWDETFPPDSVKANLLSGENIFLRTQRAVRERLETLFGIGKWSADPIGPFTGLIKNIPWEAGCEISGVTPANNINQSNGFLTTNITNSQIIWRVPILLPIGCKITKLRAYGYRDVAGAAVFAFTGVKSDGTAESNIHATQTSVSTSGLHFLDSGALTETIVNTSKYAAVINIHSVVGDASAARFGWLEVTYDLPTSAIINCIGA